MAKATLWSVTDAEERKRGERTGLDTLVVHAVNDECYVRGFPPLSALQPRIKHSAWEYGRKTETQSELTGPAQAVEHVV